jgi:SNF2 family DNA or RNA helicase
VQNNLHESWALLHFLAPYIFTQASVFDEAFDLNHRPDDAQGKEAKTKAKGKSKHTEESDGEEDKSEGENAEDGEEAARRKAASAVKVDRAILAKAHYMMRPFVLRRLKAEVEQSLPPKLETRIDCPMTPMQRFWMRHILLQEGDFIQQIESERLRAEEIQRNLAQAAGVNADARRFSVGKSNSKRLQNLVAQLRKASNHPFLFDGVETPTSDGLATEEIIAASGKMVVLDQLLRKLKEKGHRVVLFSQYTRMLDIICDFLHLRDYEYCRLDGSTNRVRTHIHITYPS